MPGSASAKAGRSVRVTAGGPRRRSTLRTLLAYVWVGAFLAAYFSFPLPNNPHVHRLDVLRNVPALLLELLEPTSPSYHRLTWMQYARQRWDVFCVAAFVWAAAFCCGRLAVRCCRLPLPERSAERNVLAAGVGLSLVSLATLGLGRAGLLDRAVFVAVLAAFIGVEVSFCLLRRWRTRKASVERRVSDRHGPPAGPRVVLTYSALGSGLLWAAALCFVALMFLGAALPPVDFDVKEYHLQGPKEFLQNGRITMLPHNVYTSFPFLTEMLSLAAMVVRGDWFRGALAGKLVLAVFGPLTALGLYAFGRRLFSPAIGALAALIHLSTPWIYRISIIAYAEGGLTFYLFATLACAMWMSSEPVALRAWSGPLLLGFLAGSAMACKYPAAVTVVMPAFVWLCVRVLREPQATAGSPSATSGPNAQAGDAPRRAPQARRLLDSPGPSEPSRRLPRRGASELLRVGGLFALGAALAVGPWLLKNWQETGNPVYPLLYSVFGGVDWDSRLDARWRAAHSPPHYHVADAVVKLIDVTLKSDWQSGLVFALAVLAAFGISEGTARRRLRMLWGVIGYELAVWWLLTHRIDRFWVPLLPAATWAAGVAWAAVSSRRDRLALCGVSACVAVYNFAFMTTPLCGLNSYRADLRQVRFQAEGTAPAIRFLNHSDLVPPGGSVLCVGEAQVFDARFPLLYNTVFDYSLFELIAAERQPGVPVERWPMRAPEQIRSDLLERRVALVLVNWQEILRYRTTYGYAEFVSPERFDQLQRAGVLRPVDLPPELTWAPLEGTSPQVRAELAGWGRRLLRQYHGMPAYRRMQLFRVLSPGTARGETR